MYSSYITVLHVSLWSIEIDLSLKFQVIFKLQLVMSRSEAITCRRDYGLICSLVCCKKKYKKVYESTHTHTHNTHIISCGWQNVRHVLVCVLCDEYVMMHAALVSGAWRGQRGPVSLRLAALPRIASRLWNESLTSLTALDSALHSACIIHV